MDLEAQENKNMEKEIEELKTELRKLEEVVLANRGIIMFLFDKLGIPESEYDFIEKMSEDIAKQGFKEFDEMMERKNENDR